MKPPSSSRDSEEISEDTPDIGHTNDTVRMYMREMGAKGLLNRDKELKSPCASSMVASTQRYGHYTNTCGDP